MTNSDPALRWGLPPGFRPVLYPLEDGVKQLVRELLNPGEPVIASLANENNNISVVATPYRLFSIRSGGAGAGVTGYNTREFPWEGITGMLLQQVSLNVKFVLSYRTTDGRTVEVGRRAALGKDAKDNLMPFEAAAGAEVFEAIRAVWHHKTQTDAL